MEKLIDEGGAAFPCAMSEQSMLNQQCEPFQVGMTLRDYYAGKAMEGLFSAVDKWPKQQDLEKVARLSFRAADEMLIARNSNISNLDF